MAIEFFEDHLAKFSATSDELEEFMLRLAQGDSGNLSLKLIAIGAFEGWKTSKNKIEYIDDDHLIAEAHPRWVVPEEDEVDAYYAPDLENGTSFKFAENSSGHPKLKSISLKGGKIALKGQIATSSQALDEQISTGYQSRSKLVLVIPEVPSSRANPPLYLSQVVRLESVEIPGMSF